MRLDLFPRFLEGLGMMDDASPIDEEPAESLKVVLMGTRPAASRSFTRFAKEALCEEALLFWVEANDYALLFQPSDLLARAATIYETYLSQQAKYRVNLSDKIIAFVEKAIEEEKCSNSLFQTAQTEVSDFLTNDVFPRYQDWLKKEAMQGPIVRQQTDKKLLDSNLLGDRGAMLEALKELLEIPEEMAELRRVARMLEAEENLEFYSEMHEYKQLFSAQDRLERAEYIYKRYVNLGADHLVTLPDKCVRAITKQLENKVAPAELFDEAYRETLMLCTDNIYPVYLKKVNKSNAPATATATAPAPAPTTGGCCLIM